MSGRTPVLGSALHRHPHCATTDHARLPLSGLPSGQTQVQGLPQTPLPEQQAPDENIIIECFINGIRTGAALVQFLAEEK